MFKCHCGEVHDSTVRGPCPQVYKLSYPGYPGHVRPILTTELERYMLAAALRARHPTMSKSMQSLHDRLLPTAVETQYGKEFVEAMAHATPEERIAISDRELKRCEAEEAFIAEQLTKEKP